MSPQSYYLKPDSLLETSVARRRPSRWTLSGIALAALALLGLSSCGPDIGPGAAPEASGAPSAGPSAASAAASEAPAAAPKPTGPAAAIAPAAPACPKLAEPKCPVAPAAAPSAGMTPRSLAAGWSKASRRLWAHHGGEGHGMHAARVWTHHHRRSEDREVAARDQGSPPTDRYAEAGQTDVRGGYRMREEAGESVRSEARLSGGDGRLIIRRREDIGAMRPCPRACPGAPYRDWDYAGIDARGYLVWPGKVEY